MIRISVKLEPVTKYVISSPFHKPGESKTYFYFGVNPRKKVIPISTLKGMLRTAAVYAYPEDSCEFQTSKKLLEYKAKHPEEKDLESSLTCARIQDIKNNEKEEYEKYKKCLGEEIIKKFSTPCIICRVFGNTKVRGKARIIYKGPTEVEIEAKRFKFSWGKELEVEVTKQPIEFDVLCEDEECKEVILKALEKINEGIVRIGRFKSRGLGILKAEYKII